MKPRLAVPLALLLAGPAAAQWQTAGPVATARWIGCRIETPAYRGSCRATVFTLRDGSLNVHFDTDDSSLEGLTWDISAMPPEGSDVFPVVLTAERIGIRSTRLTAGECRLSKQEIFCITQDGQQSAVARGRLRLRK